MIICQIDPDQPKLISKICKLDYETVIYLKYT